MPPSGRWFDRLNRQSVLWTLVRSCRACQETDGAARAAVHESPRPPIDEESEFDVYAIVRAGGRQEKVSVGDVLVIDKVTGKAGETVELAPVLLVDGTTITTDAQALASAKVTVEVVAPFKGPKITIMKFKNKTGYRKRQGHRQHQTKVKVTAIEA